VRAYLTQSVDVDIGCFNQKLYSMYLIQIYIYFYISIYLSIPSYLSVHTRTYTYNISLDISVFIYLSGCLFIFASAHLSIDLHVYSHIYLSIFGDIDSFSCERTWPGQSVLTSADCIRNCVFSPLTEETLTWQDTGGEESG